MKRKVALIAIAIMIIIIQGVCINESYCESTVKSNNTNSANNSSNVSNSNNADTKKTSEEKEAIPSKTESTIVELKEKEMKSLSDYQERYGSKSYGMTAYILHKVQVYSIPFCFLGIVVGAICQYVLGIRHLETQERGLALMVIFIVIGIVCQVSPLVFTILVKFGRE